jgi:hypothetical protein
MHARESIHGEHMANGGHVLVSHWIASRLWPHLILPNLILHQFTLPHRDLGALDLLLLRFRLHHLCEFVPIPVCSRGIHKPKIYTNGTYRYVLFTASGEPHNHQEALCDSRCKSAMDLEYGALMKKQTCHLVPPKKGTNIIDCT